LREIIPCARNSRRRGPNCHLAQELETAAECASTRTMVAKLWLAAGNSASDISGCRASIAHCYPTIAIENRRRQRAALLPGRMPSPNYEAADLAFAFRACVANFRQFDEIFRRFVRPIRKSETPRGRPRRPTLSGCTVHLMLPIQRRLGFSLTKRPSVRCPYLP